MDLTFTNNSKNIEIAEAEIERTYNNMIRLLNIEKAKLMAVLKDLKNQKYLIKLLRSTYFII